jgi:hypothetical protein
MLIIFVVSKIALNHPKSFLFCDLDKPLFMADYKEEVLAICQRAETDVQMEFSLQNCEEVWFCKVLLN